MPISRFPRECADKTPSCGDYRTKKTIYFSASFCCHVEYISPSIVTFRANFSEHFMGSLSSLARSTRIVAEKIANDFFVSVNLAKIFLKLFQQWGRLRQNKIAHHHFGDFSEWEKFFFSRFSIVLVEFHCKILDDLLRGIAVQKKKFRRICQIYRMGTQIHRKTT